jgi:hypothetical protein
VFDNESIICYLRVNDLSHSGYPLVFSTSKKTSTSFFIGELYILFYKRVASAESMKFPVFLPSKRT